MTIMRVHLQTCEEKLLLETLQGCPKLRVVSLEGNLSSFLTDKFFERLVSRNQLETLEILDFQGTKINLGMRTAKQVLKLQNLRELRVSTWSLRQEELDEIKAEVEKNGWDLAFRS